MGNGEALDLISEWGTPNLISIQLFPFLLGIIAILLGAIRGRVATSDLWLIAPFLGFAFTANRSVPLAGLVLAPWFVTAVMPIGEKATSTTRVQGLVNTMILALVVVLPWVVPMKGGLDIEMFAVDAIEELQPGPLFHDDAVGGYLIYANWPERLVYIDDRAELYEEEFVDFVKARDADVIWREVFARHNIEQALLKKEDRLSQILVAEGWDVVFEDDTFMLLAAP